ncbi:salicylic acid-binding protein 2-like [Vicia villosa]|uniref:salicylic acid-binding protein 2-like n=1 Tax=Vicia villosa TaxID=3911 RepID=UPI00273B2660|nr:salicylic acid-binding protein 2-like [Vicia villosa]
MSTENVQDRKHYVLVHGAGHGAWCWYKVKPMIESSGHLVTVIDLAASGINSKKIEDVDTISEYSEPLLELMATIPTNEKVILVGHSFGGLSIALAMEQFPENISVAVFLTAFVPDIQHKPSYVMEKYLESIPAADWLDTEFSQSGNKTAISFGPKFLSNRLYPRSSPEDLELAKSLVRPSSLFMEDLTQQNNLFSKQGYGSVPTTFIRCNGDTSIPLNFQLWMIQNAGINHVFEINDSDHMAMISKPQQVCDSLYQIAAKYA